MYHSIFALHLGRTSAAPRRDKILAPGVVARGLGISDAGMPDASLVLGREQAAVGIDEGHDGGHIRGQLVPLAAIEGDREAA